MPSQDPPAPAAPPSSKRPRLTLVSAAYIVGRYLDEFVASIEKRTFDLSRVEVILLDDGSTDDSLAQAFDTFARETLRVRLMAGDRTTFTDRTGEYSREGFGPVVVTADDAGSVVSPTHREPGGVGALATDQSTPDDDSDQ